MSAMFRALSTCLLVAGCADPDPECVGDTAAWVTVRPGWGFLAEQDGVVLVASMESLPPDNETEQWNHTIAAMRADDGSLLWEHSRVFDLEGWTVGVDLSPTGAAFTVDGDRLAVLRRLDPVDGTEIWQQSTVVPEVQDIEADDSLVVLSGIGVTSAYDTETGDVVWSIGEDPGSSYVIGAQFNSIAFAGSDAVGIGQDLASDEPRPLLDVVSRTTGETLWSDGEGFVEVDLARLDDGDIVVALRRDPNDAEREMTLTRFSPDGQVRWTRTYQSTDWIEEIIPNGDAVILVGDNNTFQGEEVGPGWLPEYDESRERQICRYLARVSAEDGSAISVASTCVCTDHRTFAATMDASGRLYSYHSSPSMDAGNFLAAFDPTWQATP